jgi:hypothetical protein
VIWTIIWEELVCKADIIKPHCVPHDSSGIDSLTEILCRLVDCNFFKQFLRAVLRSSISYPMKDWRIRAWVQSHLRVNELYLTIKERSNFLEVIYALNHMILWWNLFCCFVHMDYSFHNHWLCKEHLPAEFSDSFICDNFWYLGAWFLLL